TAATTSHRPPTHMRRRSRSPATVRVTTRGQVKPLTAAIRDRRRTIADFFSLDAARVRLKGKRRSFSLDVTPNRGLASTFAKGGVAAGFDTLRRSPDERASSERARYR